MTKTLCTLLENKIVAIVRGVEEEKILPLAEALMAGGIRCMEVTFDQSDPRKREETLHSVRLLRERAGEELCVGAGTVMSDEQVRLACEAGAKYIISPNTNEEVIRETKALGLVSIPGAMSPTEIDSAHRCGADIVKVFPAGTLGPGYFKAVLSPLKHIRLQATGGVGLDNCASFLAAGAVSLGIGGRLADKKLIERNDFRALTEIAGQFVSAVNP